MNALRTPFILFLAVALVGCHKGPQSASPADPDASLRGKVVEQVRAGVLKPDPVGVVILPDDLKPASANGQVLVGQHPVAGLLVAFPVQTAEGMSFLLYVEKPTKAGLLQVGPLAMRPGKPLKEHWYETTSALMSPNTTGPGRRMP
jgi:hypothetical protein